MSLCKISGKTDTNVRWGDVAYIDWVLRRRKWMKSLGK